jgi:tetratricopeptide (TPR) repeat protein
MRSVLDKIRFLKTKRNFDKALTLVNDLLDQDPNFAEALYLKAHVLWEGFKNPWGAESCFRRVLELTKDSEPVHCWASSCLLRIYNKVSQ